MRKIERMRDTATALPLHQYGWWDSDELESLQQLLAYPGEGEAPALEFPKEREKLSDDQPLKSAEVSSQPVREIRGLRKLV